MQPLTPASYADIHVHPSANVLHGPPPRGVAASIRAALEAMGLRVAVLADHDRIDVAQALAARTRDEGAAIELIVGEEITTREGHLLGIGLSRRVPPHMRLDDTIAAVHDQGGLAVVAHPLLPPLFAAGADRLLDLAQGDVNRRPDGLEVVNAVGLWLPLWRRRVERLARLGGYAMVGGSDAHRAAAVGRGRTGFPGDDAIALLHAIRGCETWAEGERAALGDVLRR